MNIIKKLIINSGGQSGVDRAALDTAVSNEIQYSGWCPAGGWAEDLTEPPGLLVNYPEMKETPDSAVEQRTEWNVRDSTATLIFLPNATFRDSPGTNYTIDMAHKWSKPYVVIDLSQECQLEKIVGFVQGVNQPELILNFAGPRESEAPGIYQKSKQLIEELLKTLHVKEL